MTAERDPYPETLDDIPFNEDPKRFVNEATPNAVTTGRDYLMALNRIATALERLSGFQPAQNAPQPARPALAPLPAVQTVANRPACPLHGVDKVASSKQGPGFYCQAKALPGQPANPKGYCTWHS